MWSTTAWNNSIKTIKDIEKCPFVIELANGTLDFKTFIFYIEQDNIYLRNFSARLELLYSQITDNTAKSFIRRCIDNTLELENGLHAYIAETFNVHFDENAPLTPANIRYNQLYEEIKHFNNPALTFASLLPCYWVYAHIGKMIYDNMSPNNPYNQWIETYGDEAFITEAETFRNLCDQHANSCTDKTKNQMTSIFTQFTELELQFWNDSYKANLPNSMHK